MGKLLAWVLTTAVLAQECAVDQLTQDWVKQRYHLTECHWRRPAPDGATNYYYCYAAGADDYFLIKEYETGSGAGRSADSFVYHAQGDAAPQQWNRVECSCDGSPNCYEWR